MSTIKKIAQHAKLSIGTVDRVLHERGNVSKDAEARVLKAIEELNYKPNFFARQLKLARTRVFGIIMPEFMQDSGYWFMPAQGIDLAKNELEQHRIEVQYFHYDRYDEKSFVSCCERALQNQLDGYLVAPALPDIARRFSENLPEHIPCVYFDSSVPNSQCLCSIVQDSYTSGLLAGRLMHLLTENESSVAVIRCHEKDYHIQQRVSGFIDFYAEQRLAKPQLVNRMNCDSHSDLYDFFKGFLNDKAELQGLFVTDAATYCAAKALEELKPGRKIYLIGYDLLPENIHHLKNGTIDFLISQKSKQQGYQGLYALFRHTVLKEKVSSTIMMPIDIITRENVAYRQHD